jgi:hypothetical protein
MKNWPHQILETLRVHYSETTTDLTRFSTETLKISKDNRIKSEKIKDLLIFYEEKKYLTWKVLKNHPNINLTGNKEFWKSDPEYKKYFGTHHKGIDETFANNRVEAQLTPDGLDYAIELYRERQKHKIYKYSTPMSVMFAALAFSISLMTYWRGCDQKNQQQLIQLQLPTTPTIDSLSLKKVHIQILNLPKDSETILSKEYDPADLSTQPVDRTRTPKEK